MVEDMNKTTEKKIVDIETNSTLDVYYGMN